MLAAPRGISAATSSGKLGAAAASSPKAPKPSAAATSRRRPELVGLHRPQGDDHHGEGEGVDRETRRYPEQRDHRAGDPRPEDPRGLDDDAVEADRVDDAVSADHLDHKALAGRVVDRVDA